MKIDKLIEALEELRSKHEDISVYVWDQDWGWEEFSIQVVEKGPGYTFNPPPEEIWIGLG